MLGDRLGGEVGLAGQVVVGGLVGAGGGAQPGWRGRAGVGDLGQAWAEQVVVSAGEQQRVVQAGVGDLVAAGVRDAGDEAVFTEAAQVVRHFPGGDVLGGFAEEGRDEGAQLAVGEAAGQQPVDEQGLQQRVDPGVAEPQCGDAGAAGHDDGRGQGGEGPGAVDGVVADGLDAEQAPVGGEADLPQVGQAGQPFGDAEVGGRVVDGGLGPDGPAELVVLLYFRMLVVDVQARDHAVGDDAGAEPARRRALAAADDLAAEDQRDLVRAADVEVVADDLLEEDPPGGRPAQDLGEGELGLRCPPVSGQGSNRISPGKGRGNVGGTEKVQSGI